MFSYYQKKKKINQDSNGLNKVVNIFWEKQHPPEKGNESEGTAAAEASLFWIFLNPDRICWIFDQHSKYSTSNFVSIRIGFSITQPMQESGQSLRVWGDGELGDSPAGRRHSGQKILGVQSSRHWQFILYRMDKYYSTKSLVQFSHSSWYFLYVYSGFSSK